MTMDTITIYGMTEKCYAVLSVLLDRYPSIVDTVITSRDGSIVKDYHEEIIDLCLRHGIHVHDRTEPYAMRTKFAVAISWRWLITLNATRLIVFHDSILPRYRGFNPLPSALINGDKEIGVTALYATEEYDRGAIIAHSTSRISYPIRIKEAIEIITKNYQDLAIQVVSTIAKGIEPYGMPQNEADASYSLWRDEEDYFVDWSTSASYIKRFVDAVGYPYHGAAARMSGKNVRILDATAIDDVYVVNRTPGKVIFMRDSKPVVVCGQGLLKIDTLVDDTGRSLLPLSNFRTRFKGFFE
jgi:methionyl-tRNA formyltransferase